MKILGMILATVAVFLLGRYSAGQNRTESDSTAVEENSTVNPGERDSLRGDRRRAASLSDRFATGSREFNEKDVAEMLAISNWPKRRDIFEEYMKNFTSDQGPAFVAAILESNKSGASNGKQWDSLFFHWGVEDPQSALAFLENAETSEWRQGSEVDAKYWVYVGWSETDSPSAYRFAEETGYLDSNRSVLGALISNWAQQDTLAVTQHIVGESRSDLYGYLGAITEIVVRQGGVEALVSWQREVHSQNPQLVDLAGSAVAQHMGGVPPRSVADWLVTEAMDENGVVSTSIARKAYHAINSNHPQRAPELLVEMSKNDSANSAVRALVVEETQRSPGRLESWLGEREGDASVAALREIFESTRGALQK